MKTGSRLAGIRGCGEEPCVFRFWLRGAAETPATWKRPEARILIDAGLSCRETIRRLERIGVDPHTLDALVITHEHTDHIRGAGPLARRFDLSVILNSSTFRSGMGALGSIPKPVPIHTGQTITVRDLSIETFTKCHDAADPVGRGSLLERREARHHHRSRPEHPGGGGSPEGMYRPWSWSSTTTSRCWRRAPIPWT